jgi:hypothetical protein
MYAIPEIVLAGPIAADDISYTEIASIGKKISLSESTPVIPAAVPFFIL